MAFVRGIVGLVLAILFVAFAVANRQHVEIVWSPLHPNLDLPLYIVTLGALAIGFAFGAFVIWLESLPQRISKTRQIKKLKKELKGSTPPPANSVLEDWTALPPTGAE